MSAVTTYSTRAKNYNTSCSATALSLNNNPAYEVQTPLQRNIAYEDTTLNMRESEESQIVTNPAEPTYEIIPLTHTQTNATIHQDEYNKLNREISQQ